MLLCAHPAGHVLLLVVKLVVASLGAADHLGQRVVLVMEVRKTEKTFEDVFDAFVFQFELIYAVELELIEDSKRVVFRTGWWLEFVVVAV